jgi:uncharacterized protein involved in cysteine biosynthesis
MLVVLKLLLLLLLLPHLGTQNSTTPLVSVENDIGTAPKNSDWLEWLNRCCSVLLLVLVLVRLLLLVLVLVLVQVLLPLSHLGTQNSTTPLVSVENDIGTAPKKSDWLGWLNRCCSVLLNSRARPRNRPQKKTNSSAVSHQMAHAISCCPANGSSACRDM